MKYDFGIRFDVGGKIGSGHFFRVLALAKQLKKMKKKVVLLTSNKDTLHSHLKEKIPYIILDGKNQLEQIQQCKNLEKKISHFMKWFMKYFTDMIVIQWQRTG